MSPGHVVIEGGLPLDEAWRACRSLRAISSLACEQRDLSLVKAEDFVALLDDIQERLEAALKLMQQAQDGGHSRT